MSGPRWLHGPKPARALITGATRGLGASIAGVLCSEGVEVWLAGRGEERLQNVAAELRECGGRCHVIAIDLEDVDTCHRRFATLQQESGGMDLVLANAAVTGRRAGMGPLECPWPIARQIMTVNVAGVAATLWPFIEPMVARGHGRLAAMSSIAGRYPNPRTPAYGASKAAVGYLLRSMDIALRPRGVLATAIYPGFVATPGTAEIDDAMPIVVGQEVAARRLVAALRRGRRVVRFPRRLFWLSRLIGLLPLPIYDIATRSLTG